MAHKGSLRRALFEGMMGGGGGSVITLLEAARCGQDEIITLLMSRGARLNMDSQAQVGEDVLLGGGGGGHWSME